MFSQYFGEYLIQNNVITEEQLKSLVTYQDDHRAKLGIIAVSEGLLTDRKSVV